MTREKLTNAIVERAQNGEKAFVPYMMAGDGGLEKMKKDILFLQEAGVTAIELGIPFSDPVADGPVIQAAGERALAHGVTLKKVLAAVQSFQDEVKVPLVIMTYLNPILQYGIQAFVKDCVNAGISGLIIPDLPMEEDQLLKPVLQQENIALIPLVSLTSPESRIKQIVAEGEGFIYAVTVNGTTGVRNEFGKNLTGHLKQLKLESPVPVLAGFGISTATQVQEVGASVDGVIVGSAIVRALHDGNYDKVQSLVDAASPPSVLN